MTPPNRAGSGDVVVAGCLLFILVFLFVLTITTAIVFIGWNVGLEPAGIVNNKIGWGTAIGLAFCVNIVRSIFRGQRIIQKSEAKS